MFARIWNRLFGNLDGPLLMIAALIVGLGLITLYSATMEVPRRFNAQLINICVALTAMWIMAQVPPQLMMRFAVPVYVLGVALLVGVALFGFVAKGARRWLDIGVMTIQPSELMKLGLPLMLAWFFHKSEGATRLREFAVAALILAIPVGLIVRQPDLGTAILVSGAGFFVIFLAGLRWRVIFGAIAVGAAAIPFVWPLLHDYQRRRVLTMIDPTSDPLGAGYHIIQSTIAVGSGGIWGKGWLKGTQTHLEFIPERHTDFVFAVFSEEFGLVGNLVLVALYLALLTRGLMIASNATTTFGRLYAGSIVLTLFTYAFVNMGMVSGILPVVGVPLPLVSYGGTALVTLFVGIGVLMSIAKHRALVQS
jgi:rod shape determining protein RodA